MKAGGKADLRFSFLFLPSGLTIACLSLEFLLYLWGSHGEGTGSHMRGMLHVQLLGDP